MLHATLLGSPRAVAAQRSTWRPCPHPNMVSMVIVSCAKSFHIALALADDGIHTTGRGFADPEPRREAEVPETLGACVPHRPRRKYRRFRWSAAGLPAQPCHVLWRRRYWPCVAGLLVNTVAGLPALGSAGHRCVRICRQASCALVHTCRRRPAWGRDVWSHCLLSLTLGGAFALVGWFCHRTAWTPPYCQVEP